MDSSAKPSRKNPRQNANIISQLIFAWAIPLLYRGSRRGLNTDDLTECLKEDRSEQLGDRLEEQWYKELEKSHRKKKTPHLRNALFRCFLKPTIVNGLICLIYIVIKTLIPAVLAQLLIQFQKAPVVKEVARTSDDDELLLLASLNRTARSIGKYVISQAVPDGSGSLNDTFSPNSLDKGDPFKEPLQPVSKGVDQDSPLVRSVLDQTSDYVWNDAYCLGTVLVTSTLFCCFLLHHVDLRQRLMGARMRIACCSLIYRKTLRLSMKTAGQTPAGYLINLLSNDVNRLDYGFIFMHWIWIMPLQALLTCYLIWLNIGIPALVGVIGLLLKTVPVQTALSKVTSVLRMRIAERTDARVGIMNELVQGIQVIKMYAWERPFQAVVAEARRREIKQIRYASYLRGFYLSTMVFTERSTLYITLAAAALMGQTITADFVFSAASYYNILQLVAAIWYPLAVSFGAEALVSLQRIQDFLILEGREERTHGLTHKREQEAGDSRAVTIKDINASWDNEKPQRTLQGINLQIEKGQLCAVIGPVGAGKSSILQLLLGELPIIDGGVVIQGDLSYAAQEPWLFTGSVRHNILFGEEYERKRYQEVTKCCALATDFQQLPSGDKTIVGERGASLSGGQRARISLARAVYKPASIYLLDDPLSAVDAHVGRHLFDEVIGPRGRLAQQKATRILVTHQIHFLSEADLIVIVDQGRILRQGTYQELLSSDLDFAKLLERPKEEREAETSRNKSSISDQRSLDSDDEDIPFIDGEKDGYQQLRKQSTSVHGSKSLDGSQLDEEADEEALAEAQASGGIQPRVWYEYFHAGSTLVSFSFMVFVMIMSQVVCSSSDFFANIWTQQEHQRSLDQPTSFTTFECLYIYGALIIAVVIMTTFRGFLFFKICMHASKVLHDRMFACILHATMRFFDTTPSGRILNRFSKDMGAIDELLPRAIMDFIQIALVMFGILIVISIVNPVLIAAMLVVAVVDVLILKLYLRPSQDLKRLEGICRSPVFSHLSASLSGLAIIRSRQLQEVVAKEFDLLQDVHSSVWQLTMAANTALGLWLDCVSCVFLTSVTFSFIVSNESTYSGNVGLAISQAMILTGMVQYGVRQVAESLQQMTSVERVLQYTELEQEPALSEKAPPPQWPTQGQVEFRNMSCRYDPNGSPVLKNLSLTIEAGWKVGIVGRTGAGKSSLIGALFRLAHIEGEILIDGVETGTIALEILRTRISIIPQDPVLFSATIRYNLDPFERYTDAELWSALEDVELRGAIPGLDYMVTERGSNFSVGQRQLLCLARAILRNNKVLVLDEATANVDPQTDGLIQRTIRIKFQHSTVLTVAHRLHTVMDSDRIIVMDAGNAVEYDVPHLLLKKSRGHLRQMVEATGGEADALKKVASDSHKRMQRLRDERDAEEEE